MVNRRELLLMGLGAGVAAAQDHAGPMKLPIAPRKPLSLKPYVDPLPIPPVIRPAKSGAAVQVRMQAFRHKAHRDMPAANLWGYNGMWPGPTFEVRSGEPLAVEWINALPTKHFLPIDPTIHGAEKGTPEARTVVHVHGARVLPESDGYPDAWYTSNGKHGSYYKGRVYRYPNEQHPAMLWYHDHSIGITRLNVYAGLAGFYVIRDKEEDALNLPGGPYELPLLIQDRSFNADGSLLYPIAQNSTRPIWVQEFFGETICVNGRAMPYVEVEPRRYRLRLANGSNSRFYHLVLAPADESGQPSGKAGEALEFHQIGTDGGLLPAPLAMSEVLLGPAERLDLVVDFAGRKGGFVAMVNDAAAPYTRGGNIVPAEVMLFKVTRPLAGKDTSALPDRLNDIPRLDPAKAARERLLPLTEEDRPGDGYTVISLLGQKTWSEPISENPRVGSTEVWAFANTTMDVHPIHVHLVRFQVVNRQPFDAKAYVYSGRMVYTGVPEEPAANESPAWKDTIPTYPGYVTRVIQRFDLPEGTVAKPGQEFRYVWHCHMLEHEDNEMMRPYNVVG